MNTAAATAGTELRRGTLWAFVAPTLILGVMHGPEGQIQGVYAKHGGVALTALALALMASKIFDAITYPLVGYLSDQTFARRGTRKAWILAGMVLSVVGMWMLMRPPANVDAWYFGIWMAALYFGWKLMEIPLQAWSYGLSEDYRQRSRVQAWKTLAQLAGSLLFFAIPFFAMKAGQSDSTELDFRSLGFSALICAGLLPLATLIALTFVKEGGAMPAVVAKPPRMSFRDAWDAVRSNRPLLWVLGGFLPLSVLGGMCAGTIYLYVDGYLGLSKQYTAIMAVAFLATLVGIPLWSGLAARYERHRVLAVAFALCGAACCLLGLLSPGPLALPLAFVAYPAITLTLSGIVVIFIMLGDVVDYGKLTTGQDHAGLYGSMLQFLTRSLTGVAAALGLAIAGLVGFDAAVSTDVQSTQGIFGLKLVTGFLPGVGMLASGLLLLRYPLNRARVAEIQAELHAREAAAAAAPAPTAGRVPEKTR